MASLKEIAREAGCAPSTVSRVLNGYDEGFSARPELRERILAAIKRTGYKPNPILRTMRAKKTWMVAVFAPPDYCAGVLSRARNRFLEGIHAAGYAEVVKYVERPDPSLYQPDFPVDAVLAFDVRCPALMAGAENCGMTYLVVNGLSGEKGVSLMVDEEHGMRLLVDHLVSLGHRRIAYINETRDPADPSPPHYSEAERMQALVRRLAHHGLEPLPGYDDQRSSPRDLLAQAVRNHGATAVICYDDRKVIDVAYHAWELGIAVPGQVSLAGFNNEHVLSRLTPPVTVVATPADQLGLEAARILLAMLEGDTSFCGKTYRYPGDLVVRQSTARPAGSPLPESRKRKPRSAQP